jgi:murein DD-endopeptidase MepM/ murein hydrolase activator NlpD
MIAILLLALLAGPAWGETILLASPRALVCQASPDAEFVLDHGELRPLRGRFAFSPPGEPALEPRFSIPRDAEPGGTARVQVRSTDVLDSLSVQLTDARGKSVGHATVFRMAVKGQDDAWAALVGVPSTAVPGQYVLDVKASAGDRTCLQRALFAVTEKAFAAETIDLSSSLSALRTSADPRKTEEAHALLRVLSAPHPEAVFEQGAFSMPLPAGWRQTAAYGDRRRYRYADGAADQTVHNGIDMAAPAGSPVSASGKGRVVLAGDRIMSGKTIVLEHLPGLFSIYYHMSEILVQEGDILAAGQTLGRVGQTGLATGPHLHWEVQVLGTAVDPLGLVRRPVLDTEAAFRDIQDTVESEGR